MAYIKLIVLGAFAAILIGGAIYLHHAGYESGVASCQAKVARAIQQQQNIADQNASVYEAQQQKERIVYRTRIKEVEKKVPVNHSCDLPPDTVKLLNNAISAAGTSAR